MKGAEVKKEEANSAMAREPALGHHAEVGVVGVVVVVWSVDDAWVT